MLKTISLFCIIFLAGCGRPAPQPAAQPAPRQTQAPAEPAPVIAEAPRPSPMGSAELTPAEAPHPAVRIPGGTVVRVRLANTIDTSRNRAGDRFTAHLDTPITEGGQVIVPKGTTFQGHLTAAKSSGRLRGRAVLGLTLDSFHLNGRTYPVDTSSVARAGNSHKRRNLGLIGGGSGLGALLGAIAGGGKGALIGAGAGAAAGTAGAAITGKKNIRLPVETPITFTIRRPVVL